MRDETIIREMNQMKQYIQMLENSVRLAFTGQEIRGAAIQALLITKGTFTQEELTAEIGATITKMQAQAEDAQKKAQTEIIKPTTEQVQQVTNTPVQVEVLVIPEVIPPQA
jgi:uncharacterized iron-regulated protein